MDIFQQLFWMTESCMAVHSDCRGMTIFEQRHKVGLVQQTQRVWSAVWKFVGNYCWVLRWKNFEKWSACDKVGSKSWHLFLRTPCL